MTLTRGLALSLLCWGMARNQAGNKVVQPIRDSMGSEATSSNRRIGVLTLLIVIRVGLLLRNSPTVYVDVGNS